MKKVLVSLLIVILSASSLCFAAGASEDDGMIVIKGYRQPGQMIEHVLPHPVYHVPAQLHHQRRQSVAED